MASQHRTFDRRDRLILALVALLRAERETRAVMEEAIAGGVLSPQVLAAMAADPVPAITEQDLVDAEAMLRTGPRGPLRFVA